MTSFRERNPVPIGAATVLTVVVVVLAAFNLGKLPGFRGDTYRAAFSDANGLHSGSVVQVAGIRVGRVDGIDLAGDHVVIEFQVDKGVELGSETSASIEVLNMLGEKYLELQPAGSGELSEMIPLSRTVPAYDIVGVLSDLTETTEGIDTAQLSKALDTLSATFKDSPEEIRSSFEGLSRLSRTIASRDAALQELLGNAASVSGLLNARKKDISALVRDGDLLLKEVRARRAIIHELLVSTSRLSRQLTGLVRDNEKQLAPALHRLHDVLRILRKNKRDLDRGLKAYVPYITILSNIIGTGPWFDAYVPNLVSGDFTPGRRPGGGG